MLSRIRTLIRRLVPGRTKARPGRYTYRDLAATGHPVDDFFSSDGVDWVAVRSSPKAVTAAAAELMQTRSVLRRAAEKRPAPDDFRTHWVVYRYAGSGWTHLRLVQGGGGLYDRHVRELSQRTGAETLLVYGRNKYDKCRALACIYYSGGEPRETLLLGADEDQDLVLDHLGLDDEEAGELSFDFEFEEARHLPKEFLARRGLEDSDASGELERMDVLIR